MAVCQWCGGELPYWWGKKGRPARYCCPSHRQAAYFARLSPIRRAAQLARKAAHRKEPDEQ
jgi:hypothetical protein